MDTIAFDHPHLLWLLLLAIPIAWLGRWTLVTLEPVRRWAAIGLRLAVLVLIVLMLAGLQAVQTHDDLTLVAALDQSASVEQFAAMPSRQPAGDAGDGGNHSAAGGDRIEAWTRRYLGEAAADQQSGDRFAWLRFDARPTIQRMPGPGLRLDSGTVDQPVEGTDIASAIRTAMRLPATNTAGRIVLFSDGNHTLGPARARAGDVLAAAREAKAKNIPIDVVPFRYNVKQEAMVEAVHAPTEARKRQTVPVRVVLRATTPMRGRVQLVHDEAVLDLNGEKPGKGAPVAPSEWTRESTADNYDVSTNQSSGRTNNDGGSPASGAANNRANNAGNTPQPGRYLAVKTIELPLRYSGINEFEALFEPAKRTDRIADNNTAQGFTLVHGKGEVLFVSNVAGSQGNILPRALRDRGIELDLVQPSGLPARMSRLQRYDAVVLQNVPAERVTAPQQQMVARYVNDLGGGFLMVGGPKSFGAGGWTNSPIDSILPVNCQIPSQTVLPSGALALVIDRSGSMTGGMGTGRTKLQLANEAAVLALQTLYPQDLISVIAFDNSAKVVVPLQPNANPNEIASKVRSIRPAGGTNIYGGLEAAYQQLRDVAMQDAAIKHVVLLTDGHSQSGDYVKLVGEMMKRGITLSTVGVGGAPNAQLLQRLAQMTGGRYHPINNPNNLPQVFVKEARTIRKNLIKETTFTPTLYPSRSPIMAGFDGVPALDGLVLTGQKDDPRVFMPLVGQEGEPVFAHWQVGLGRAAAFTSDANTRWAGDWVQWAGYGDFWAAVMRRISRPSPSQRADLETYIEGGALHIRLDAATTEDGNRFADFQSVKGSIIKPGGEIEENIQLHQTGPGVYEATTSAPEAGNYIVNLLVNEQGEGRRQSVFGGATKKRGNELRRFQSNTALLKRVAEITGGRVLNPAQAAQANLFTPERAFTTRSVRPMWRTLLLLTLIALLLDVANRRVAWEPRAVWAWTREKAAAAGALMRNRRAETEQTLGSLKQRREQVREQQQQTQSQSASTGQRAADASETAAAPATPSRQARFDTGKSAKPDQDFTAAVGGAKDAATTDNADTGQTQQSGGEQADADTEPASTGSRLRAAKQRSRQKMQDDHRNQ